MREVVLLDLERGSDLWGEMDGFDVEAEAPGTALGLEWLPQVFDLIRRVNERAVCCSGETMEWTELS